jgi:TonB family protein
MAEEPLGADLGFTIPGYKPVEKLGSDRLGVRYKGRRRSDSASVLIRIIKRKVFGSEDAEDRFRQRLFELSELSHPNISTLLEYRQVEGRFVLIYSMPNGRPLSQVFEESPGTFSQTRTVSLALQLLAALEHANDNGLIHHGELVPDNVYVAGSGGVSVLEMGLVDSTGRMGLSTAGIPAETLPYLSPERLLGRGVFHRSDIYSVGMLMYRMLTGRFPFPVSGGTEAVVESVKRRKYPSPAKYNPKIGEGLAKAIRRALLKHPSRRLPDAVALRELIEPFAKEAPGRPAAGAEAEEATAAKEPKPEPDEARKRKRRRAEARRLRQAKAEAVVDKGLRHLSEDRLREAVESARRAFGLDPSCDGLPDLLDRLESLEEPEAAAPEQAGPAVEEKPRKKVGKTEVFEGLFEKELGEEAEEIPGLLESAPSHTDPEREEYLISEIRSQMKQNNFREAAIVAGDAHREFPDNSQITELYVRLDKLFHPEKYRVPDRELRRRREEAERKAAAAAEAEPTITEEELEELEEEEYEPAMAPSRRWTLIAVIGGVLALAAAFVLVVLPRISGEPEEPAGPAPYEVALHVDAPDTATVLFDGSRVEPDRQGTYTLSGTDYGPLQVEVRARGSETIRQSYTLAEGTTVHDTLRPPPLGTGTAVLDLAAEVLPGGAPPEDPGQVTYYLDTMQVSPGDSVPTGRYLARAELEGFRPIPETLLVSRPDTFSATLQLGPVGTSEIRLAIGGNVPGTADFYVDGQRVGGGRSVVYPAELGTHTIGVRMEGRESWSRLIELGQDGYRATVSPEEQVRTGRLLIAPEPWASVEIDGRSYGETPMPPIELEEGEYTVRLSNPEYEEQVQTVEITAGEDTPIRYTASLQADDLEEITGGDQAETVPPQVISRTEPDYPEEALAQEGLSGSVTLYVTVDTDGRVSSVRVAHDGVGYGFAEAAVDAVEDWLFAPGTRDGEPVQATRPVTITYSP